MSRVATAISPEARAAETVRSVLGTQWDGAPALRLDSPPGAGKTGVTERLAAQALGLMHERCMVTTQTNEQAFDLARRIAQNYNQLDAYLLTRRGLALPPVLAGLSNLRIISSIDDLPATGPCIAISNAVKWSWLQGAVSPFDLQVVDEAFQLPDYRFQLIASLARRFVLVGDPGQIAPVITCEIERWKCDPAGPHVACPFALTERYPSIPRLALPISRRLVPDTVRIIQPAFYPDLPFEALAAPGSRTVSLTALSAPKPVDQALRPIMRGASLALVELPPRITGEVDEELSQTIVAMIERLIERGASLNFNGERRLVTPEDIGVVCAHVSQVSAVRERLSGARSRVFVETSDRFQGLERPLMFVHHPLSGRADASEFHLDAGRLCVMMSRHSVACWLVSRGGIEKQLMRHAPVGDRVLGLNDDAEYDGWKAHLYVVRELGKSGQTVIL